MVAAANNDPGVPLFIQPRAVDVTRVQISTPTRNIEMEADRREGPAALANPSEDR